MRKCQHRQGHQPERKLRTPHLVDQKESGDHQKSQLRHPRPARRGQCDVTDCAATQQHQHRDNAVEHHRGLPEPQTRVEALPAGEGSDDVVERIHVLLAPGVEPEELRPAARIGQHHRQIDRQPCRHRHPGGARGVAETAGAHSEQQQGQQQQRRIELGRDSQSDEDTGEHGPAARPCQHPAERQTRCQRIEIGEGLEDQDRRGGHQGGVPDPSAGQHRGGPHRRQPRQRQPEGGNVEEHDHLGHTGQHRPTGRLRHGGVGLRQCHRHVLVEPGEHRVLHVAHRGRAVVTGLRAAGRVQLQPA